MKWNQHSAIEGTHAFLSASSYHWLNYTDEKLISVFKSKLAAAKGTELHDFASRCIKLRQRLPKSNKALNAFVNDAIGYGMDSEVPLFYSINCYGTADAIYFGKQRGTDRMILRIHDLKTGEIPAKIDQLLVYAALFCLEYGFKPGEIDMELRIYQGNEVLFYNPKPEEILPVMDLIIRFSKILDDVKEQEGVN